MVSLLSSPSSPTDSIWISSQLLKWDKSCYVSSIGFRPDVKEDAVIGLLDQVLLSLGGVNQKHTRGSAANSIPMICAASSSQGTPWTEIRVLLGAQAEKRILLVICSPRVVNSQFLTAASHMTNDIHDALAQQHFLSTDEVLAVDAAESILDIPFVLDMIAYAAHMMDVAIAEEVAQIDATVATIELRCAKLITLLKPVYQRAGLALPSYPTSKSLEKYALVLEKESLRVSAVQGVAKMMILAGRKAYRQAVAAAIAGAATGTGTGTGTALSEISFLLQHITQTLAAWSSEEKHSRLARKLACVADRTKDLTTFRCSLLLALHHRTIGWGFGADARLQAAVTAVFPFVTSPVLFETKATLQSSTVMLYVTLSHLLFHGGGIVGSEVVQVLPFKTIKEIEVLGQDASEFLRITDVAGVSTIFTVTSATTPHMPHRMHDLLSLIITEKLFLHGTQEPVPPAPVSEEEDKMLKLLMEEMDLTVDETVTFRPADPPPAAPPAPPVALSPSNAATAEAAPVATSPPSVEEKPKKTLGSNIQKFLQQNQAKGKTNG